jgi:GNAT superfamily N-acetyltransferase
MLGMVARPDGGPAEVRQASDADLGPLVAAFGSRHFFGDCLRRQRSGDGVLLVAWLDGRPVGDVFLALDPDGEPEVRRWLPGVPRLVHLEVDGRVQRRGIGTALLLAGEETARRLGHRRLALGVALDNPGARRLYQRLGYADWGRGTVVGTWQDLDQDGPPVTHSEVLEMLVKDLL